MNNHIARCGLALLLLALFVPRPNVLLAIPSHPHYSRPYTHLVLGSPAINQDAPEWFFNLELVYPASRYIAAMGIGENLSSSRSDAISQLSQYFSVTVRAHIDASVNISDTLRETLDAQVETSIEETLIGVRYSSPYIAMQSGETLYYIVAAIDQRQVSNVIEQELRIILSMRDSLVEQAELEEDVIKRLPLLLAAKEKHEESLPLSTRLLLVTANNAQAALYRQRLDSSGIDKAISDTRREIAIQIDIDDQTGNVGADTIRQILSDKGVRVSADSSHLVTGSISWYEDDSHPRYATARWTVALELQDNNGDILSSININERSVGLDSNAAEIKMRRDVAAAIRDSFFADWGE